jgi:hypothetical protein
MTGDHHWIQEGIPTSSKLHIVERYSLGDGGKAFDVRLTLTDPENWKGERVNTKRFKRDERSDVRHAARAGRIYLGLRIT